MHASCVGARSTGYVGLLYSGGVVSLGEKYGLSACLSRLIKTSGAKLLGKIVKGS